MNSFIYLIKMYKMCEFDLFDEVNLGCILKEYHEPERFYYISNSQFRTDTGPGSIVLDKSAYYISKNKLCLVNVMISDVSLYSISAQNEKVKLTLICRVSITDFRNKYNTYPICVFNGDVLYFIPHGKKGLGICDFRDQTYKFLDIQMHSIYTLLESNENIVQEYGDGGFNILYKDQSFSTVYINYDAHYLSNDILYTYDNKTATLTYFNIYTLRERKFINMGYTNVTQLVISSKCTALINGNFLIIHYKKKTIVLSAEDYIEYFREREQFWFSQISFNKTSNKIAFSVRSLDEEKNSSIIIYNLDKLEVEKKIYILDRPDLKLGFMDIFD
jgi:hypothetical protein